MPRLYILDGHGYIFRAHFGLMNASRGERKEVRLSTAEGFPTGAIYVFSRMLMRLHDDVHPEHIAVVFDAGRRNFRSEIYPEYKAHRPDPPEDLVLQMPLFRRLVEAFRWPVLSIPGVEADDVIASLVTRAKERGWEVVIYSADKDLMQLVGDGVVMIDSMNQRVYTPDEVEKKFGVPPARVADFLALVGDTSDNIPGLAGVGDKTAARLLADYPSLDALIAANPVVPRLKVKQPFSDPEQLQRLQLSRQLVALRRDVELGVDLSDLVAQPWNTPALADMFKELEFQALVDKFTRDGNVAPAVEAAPTSASPPVAAVAASSAVVAPGEPGWPAGGLCTRAEDLAQLGADAAAAGELGLWVEGDGQRPESSQLVALAIAVPGRPVAYLPLAHRYLGSPAPLLPTDLAPVWRVLSDPGVGKRCHDSKRAAQLLGRHGVVLRGAIDDAMLAQFVLDPSQPAEAVEPLAMLVQAPPLAPRRDLLGRARSVESIDVETVAPWCCHAAEVVRRAAPHLLQKLDRAGLADLYRNVEVPIAGLLAQLEITGICIDLPHLQEVGNRVGAQIAAIEQSVWQLAGEEFNLGSPKQLAHLLFDKLGLVSERMKKTRTGHSTDHEVLEAMVEVHPIIRPILEHRELVKLKGTYLDALPPLVHRQTGRLHTTFNQVAAATGRISSQDPNLQNIPVRTEIGRSIRRAFVAAPGKLLLSADYSQIELRILAHLSQDPKLLAAFRSGVDVHAQTAAEIFALPLDQVGSKERRIAKAVNYGLSYGQSDFGLARSLDISRGQAHEYSQRYFERFPTIRKFMDDLIVEARARGGSRTLLGRWRPIPEISARNSVARRAAERIAQNTPMQGAGADIIKLAMLKTQARIDRDRLPVQMLLTVHDELVFEIDPAVQVDASAAIQQEMERVFPLSVPLVVDIGVASNWADV
jgi:DNA polymerase-1